MSDEAPRAPDPPASRPRTSKLVVLLLLLNLGASAFSTFKLVTAKPAAAATEAAKPPPTEIVGPVHALDPFVVNLDELGQARYLKVTLQLELVDGSAESAIDKSKQLVRDAILSHLSGLKLGDTLGTQAKDKLRADLLAKLESIVGPNRVRRLFFQEFVVQ